MMPTGIFLSSVAAFAFLQADVLEEQTDKQNSNIPEIVVEDVVVYHMIQLRLEGRRDLLHKFHAFTANIRSCSQARAIRKRLPVIVNEKRSLTADQLPDRLVNMLKDVPLGHATRLFVDPGGMNFRAFVVCDRRSISEPAQPLF